MKINIYLKRNMLSLWFAYLIQARWESTFSASCVILRAHVSDFSREELTGPSEMFSETFGQVLDEVYFSGDHD